MVSHVSKPIKQSKLYSYWYEILLKHIIPRSSGITTFHSLSWMICTKNIRLTLPSLTNLQGSFEFLANLSISILIQFFKSNTLATECIDDCGVKNLHNSSSVAAENSHNKVYKYQLSDVWPTSTKSGQTL